MANIQGIPGYTTPGVYSRTRTISRGVSIPGGLRVLAMVGLGQAEETVVLSAKGGGLDGLSPDFASTTSSDGRHFVLAKSNLVPQRTALYLNGTPLRGVEETMSSSPFDSRYDYRLDPLTGRIELQRAFLMDIGGALYAAGSSNVGDGTLSTLTLADANAPAETWTLRAASVVRNNVGDPISGLAVFTAVGSVSGQILDAYGSPVVFISDGVSRTNGILTVAITEGTTAFERNDRFTVRVGSRVLKSGDTLEARYISDADLNDPEYFTDANKLYAKHGRPTVSNTLSLGAEMAFANGAPGVFAIQAKPVLPRKTSEVVLEANNPLTADDEGFADLTAPITAAMSSYFNYPLSGVPSPDSGVNIFVMASDGTETQVFPNKVTFYDADIEADPFTDFIGDAYVTYSYTVIMAGQVEDSGNDGVVAHDGYQFTSASAVFAEYNLVSSEGDSNKLLRILPYDRFGTVVAAAGDYTIVSVDSSTAITVTKSAFGGFSADLTDLRWEIIDSADESARILFSSNLYTGGVLSAGCGIRVSYVDVDDADFFDSNWSEAINTLETIDCNMIVPLPDCCFSAIQQAMVAHCELMSNTLNKKERVCLIGAPLGVTHRSLSGLEQVAVEDIGILEGIQGDDPQEVFDGNIEDLQDFSVRTNFGGTFRAFYFWPDAIVRVIQGTPNVIHGFYLAAAAAGYFAGNPNVQDPLTRKNLVGFSIGRDKLLRPIEKNTLSGSGVTVVQPITGGGQVVHGKTTVSSGAAEEEEMSVVFIRDYTASVLRSVLETFIGKAEDSTLTAAILVRVDKSLKALIAQGVLISVRNITVERDEVDPTQWNVSVEVQPAGPVNTIFVDIGISLL